MENEYLAHHGILGQKWGVRRYQNSDGTLTEAGKKHYSDSGDGTSSDKKSSFNKDTAKKVAIATGAVLSVAAAAYIYANNKDAVNSAVSSAVTKIKDAKVSVENSKVASVAKTGKQATDKFFSNPVGKGVKKVGDAALEGAGVIIGTKLLTQVIGEDNANTLLDAKNSYTKKDDKIKYKSVEEAVINPVKKTAKKEVKNSLKNS